MHYISLFAAVCMMVWMLGENRCVALPAIDLLVRWRRSERRETEYLHSSSSAIPGSPQWSI